MLLGAQSKAAAMMPAPRSPMSLLKWPAALDVCEVTEAEVAVAAPALAAEPVASTLSISILKVVAADGRLTCGRCTTAAGGTGSSRAGCGSTIGWDVGIDGDADG